MRFGKGFLGDWGAVVGMAIGVCSLGLFFGLDSADGV